MPKFIPTPAIPRDLLPWLDQLIPERCADLDQSEREIFHYTGKRALVNRIRAEYRIQNPEE